jgi:hypothetical protein
MSGELLFGLIFVPVVIAIGIAAMLLYKKYNSHKSEDQPKSEAKWYY